MEVIRLLLAFEKLVCREEAFEAMGGIWGQKGRGLEIRSGNRNI